MKKLLSAVISALMLCLVMPFGVFADDIPPPPSSFSLDGLVYSTDSRTPGTAALAGIDPSGTVTLDDNGTLFVPSSVTLDDGISTPLTLSVTVVAYPDSDIADPLSALPAECTQISLPSTVTIIESEAFANNNNLLMLEILSDSCSIATNAFTATDNVDLYFDMTNAELGTNITYNNAVNAVGYGRVMDLLKPGVNLGGTTFHYTVLTAGTLANPGTVAICDYMDRRMFSSSLNAPETVYDDGGKYRYIYNVTEVAANAFSSCTIGYAAFDYDIKIADSAFSSGCKVYIKPDSDAMTNYESTNGAVKYTYYGVTGDDFTVGNYTFTIDSLDFASGTASLTLKACSVAGVSAADIGEDISDYDGLPSSEYLKIDNISENAFSNITPPVFDNPRPVNTPIYSNTPPPSPPKVYTIDGGTISLPLNNKKINTDIRYNSKRLTQTEEYIAEKFKATALGSFETAQKGGWGDIATITISLEKLGFDLKDGTKLYVLIFDTKTKEWHQVEAEVIDGNIVIVTEYSGIFAIIAE
jgi:hypothetical protein